MAEAQQGPSPDFQRQPADETRASLYAVAYEEGKRAVDDQIAELDSMRQRSVQFLAFVGSATAFLIGAGLGSGTRSDAFRYLATGATVLSLVTIVLQVVVLLTVVRVGKRFGRAKWEFRLQSRVLVEDFIEPQIGARGLADFYRDLAEHYDDMAGRNDPPLRTIRWVYSAFLALGSIQVLAWAFVVWFYT